MLDFIFKKGILILGGVFLLFSFVSGIFAEEFECKDYGDRNLSQQESDKVLEICDKEKEEYIGKLKNVRGEKSGIENQISQLDIEISISQSYINQKTVKANRLKRDTKLTKDDIEALSKEQKKINDSLKALIFQRNQIEGNTFVEALLSKKTLSEFFDDINTASFVEKRIYDQIKKTKQEKDDLERLTLELEERESLERELVQSRRLESEKIKNNKEEKNRLLSILKKDEGWLVGEIENKEKVKRKILARQFSVASGEKVTFGEAYNIIEPYKDDLGMDTAFVLAILFQESGYERRVGGEIVGNIGENIGQCTYKQKNPCGSNEVMKSTQQPYFENLMNDLGISAIKQKVSCPICRDGSYGGAMGPAQFMPATWDGVRKSVAKIVGKDYKKLSPFENRDAFVSSGVLLKWNYYSSHCQKYSRDYSYIRSKKALLEKCAAAKYYAGGNWFKHRNGYAESVHLRANRFREDIKTLNS